MIITIIMISYQWSVAYIDAVIAIIKYNNKNRSEKKGIMNKKCYFNNNVYCMGKIKCKWMSKKINTLMM